MLPTAGARAYGPDAPSLAPSNARCRGWDTGAVARIACPEFIGRGEESRALDAALERASAGAAPTVLVGGEAGIGKSRLVA
jgi:hypothetical protein